MNRQKGENLAAAAAITPSIEVLAHLYAEHHRRVLLAAYRITGSMADAEDVAQAVFMRVLGSESPIDNAGSYFYRAAINGALDLLRKRKVAATEPLDFAADVAMAGPDGSPEAAAAGRQLAEALRLAVSKLPEKAAEMFALRYLEDLSNRQIADLMGDIPGGCRGNALQRTFPAEENSERDGRKAMRSNQQTILNDAIMAVRTAEPETEQLQASTRRVADRLGLNATHRSSLYTSAIKSCGDVQRSLADYRAGELANSRYLLIQAHLRECGACHRYYGVSTSTAAVDWSRPATESTSSRHPRRFAWTLAPAFALLAMFFFVYRAVWQVPPGVRAEVQSIEGPAYRISEAGERQVVAGDKLLEGDHLRTSGGGHAVLRLADGSVVEVNERSALGIGARGKNTTIALENGAMIVQATHRTAGHLYVSTPDCRVGCDRHSLHSEFRNQGLTCRSARGLASCNARWHRYVDARGRTGDNE